VNGQSGPWFIGCPECDAPAEVVLEGSVASTDGPVDLVRVQCARRHWFLMEAARLEHDAEDDGAAIPADADRPVGGAS
jgi:hypothetical protein